MARQGSSAGVGAGVDLKDSEEGRDLLERLVPRAPGANMEFKEQQADQARRVTEAAEDERDQKDKGEAQVLLE